MTENYDYNFWFNQEHLHGEDIAKYGYGKDYYLHQIFSQVVTKISDVPDRGFIVVLGTRCCESFNVLCDHFGADRCVGYDLYNPTNHPRVIVKNCLELSDDDDIPIAFVQNDIGTWKLTPHAKLHAMHWAMKNIVPGGYMLGRNNDNSLGKDFETMCVSQGYVNHQLKDYPSDQLAGILPHHVTSHMLSQKNKVHG